MSAPPSAPQGSSVTAPEAHGEPKPRKILIIDPSGQSLAFLKFCADCRWPGAVLHEHDARGGLPGEEILRQGIDLLVIEGEMSGSSLGGAAWLEKMRSRHHLPPVIVLARQFNDELRSRAMAAGAFAAFDKELVTQKQFVDSAEAALQARLVPISADSADPAESSMPLLSAATHESTLSGVLNIPAYRLIRRLGQGNVGAVYLAAVEGSEHMVALKVVRLSDKDDDYALRRIMREYSILSRLDSPHIVRVYERGFAEDFGFIAMEYCDGGDLKTRIKSGVTLQRGLDYAAQILRGLQAAHAQGILHRDIKPTNVLIRTDGTLVLTDFGIAKEVGRQSSLTGTTSIVGSAYYVSPEAVRDSTADARGDLYSMGIVLYQMLIGKPPYSGRTLHEVLSAHVSDPIPRLPRHLSQAQGLLDGLLAKDPDERFQSATEALSAIDLVVEECGGSTARS